MSREVNRTNESIDLFASGVRKSGPKFWPVLISDYGSRSMRQWPPPQVTGYVCMQTTWHMVQHVSFISVNYNFWDWDLNLPSAFCKTKTNIRISGLILKFYNLHLTLNSDVESFIGGNDQMGLLFIFSNLKTRFKNHGPCYSSTAECWRVGLGPFS